MKIGLKSTKIPDQKLLPKKIKEDKERKKPIKNLLKKKKTKIYWYPVTKSFNRNLKFLEKDSSVAYIKIKTFQGLILKNFTEKLFEKSKRQNLSTSS